MTDKLATYLGDGVYASVTDEHGTIVLTTGSHINEIADNVIYLDPSVMAALVEFKDSAYRRLQERQPNEQ